MSSLKQFIRNVRAAKTIADERAVIQKESAAIRASFREEGHNPSTRRKNVAKLLYLFTLGERTHFGQIECVKLLASPKFADKRLGYLGTMLLLDENQEVLTLVTNSLKNDLKNPNQNVVGLALVTLGNIASVDMSRDLFAEVEELITCSNPYVRRKAALCAMRICRKVPDLKENFLDKARSLLGDRNNGVVLCGVTLIISLCEAEANEMEEDEDEDDVRAIEMFRPMIPVLIKLLHELTISTYTAEYDVSGIADPFLQVKLLRLLRVLGRGDRVASEKMTDILAKIATSTDSSKNVGTAVLYEVVLTILEIEADSSLRVLGVNILGKFLSVRDNNIRYVALNTLTKVVAIETNAVQRHRHTIIDCLRDPDISIRRRALDLSFTLINGANVRVLIQELLSFLEVADPEFKSLMTTHIGIAADRFAPNKRWHIDTMLCVLKLAGKYVKEQILASFVRLIATSTPDLQMYSVKKLYTYLRQDITQDGLTVVSAWAIGEYADALMSNDQFEDENLIVGVREGDLMDLFIAIMGSNYSGRVITEYLITAAMKLTTRFQSPDQIERIQTFLSQHRTNLDVEIQQRAVEYSALFAHDQVRLGAFEKMPAPKIHEEQEVLGKTPKKRSSLVTRKPESNVPSGDMLLDLLDNADTSGSNMSTIEPISGMGSSVDALADLLGGLSSSPATSSRPTMPVTRVATTTTTSTSNMDSIMDLLGTNSARSGSSFPSAVPASASELLPTGKISGIGSFGTDSTGLEPVGIEAYNKNGLEITFQLQPPSSVPPSSVLVLARFKNTGPLLEISAITMQVAVPKSQTLRLSSITKNVLGPGQCASQQFSVVDSKGGGIAKLRLRLRILYHCDGNNVVETVNWVEPA